MELIAQLHPAAQVTFIVVVGMVLVTLIATTIGGKK